MVFSLMSESIKERGKSKPLTLNRSQSTRGEQAIDSLNTKRNNGLFLKLMDWKLKGKFLRKIQYPIFKIQYA
jgi:hypothetical protein